MELFPRLLRFSRKFQLVRLYFQKIFNFVILPIFYYSIKIFFLQDFYYSREILVVLRVVYNLMLRLLQMRITFQDIKLFLWNIHERALSLTMEKNVGLGILINIWWWYSFMPQLLMSESPAFIFLIISVASVPRFFRWFDHVA